VYSFAFAFIALLDGSTGVVPTRPGFALQSLMYGDEVLKTGITSAGQVAKNNGSKVLVSAQKAMLMQVNKQASTEDLLAVFM